MLRCEQCDAAALTQALGVVYRTIRAFLVV